MQLPEFDHVRPRSARSRARVLLFALLATTLLGASAVMAKSVFLNGVNIDGVTGQEFKNVNVVIDAEGNVLITAKGYEVQAVGPKGGQKPATATKGPVSRRYFLVSETNLPGMVQYDVDVFINSVWVKRITHEDPQTIFEVTRHMRKGKNVIHFTATKNMGEGRRSVSAQHYLKIILGEGNIGGNNVMIDNPLLEYKRNASELKNYSNDYEVKGR
jgi:hypothetical protein